MTPATNEPMPMHIRLPLPMVDGFPRRNRVDLYSKAEYQIQAAVDEVEEVGAHPLLTEAVILLGRAKEAVANYVDFICPRCKYRERMVIAFDAGDGGTHKRLAQWCDECLGAP